MGNRIGGLFLFPRALVGWVSFPFDVELFYFVLRYSGCGKFPTSYSRGSGLVSMGRWGAGIGQEVVGRSEGGCGYCMHPGGRVVGLVRASAGWVGGGPKTTTKLNC